MYKFWIKIFSTICLAYSTSTIALENQVLEPNYSGPSSPLNQPTSSLPDEQPNKGKSPTVQDSATAGQSKTPKLSRFLSTFKSSGLSKNQSDFTQKLKNPLIRKNGLDETQVYIELKQVNIDALQELEYYGLTIEVTNHKLKKIQGWISSEKLESLAGLKNVVRVTTPNYSTVRKGSVNSEGDALLKTKDLEQLGFTGKGVRIGIISDGANNWRESAQSGDLPDQITTYGVCRSGNTGQSGDLCNNTSGTCNEGTAMAEIIHEIAPDAILAVSAVNTSLEFIEQIDVLINEFKADIIVDDLGFLGEPTFYDGDIANAVKAASKNVLFVSAAGNNGYGHYFTNRSYFGQSVPVDDSPNGTHIVGHNFNSDHNNPDSYHGFIIPGNSATTIVLNWDGRTKTVSGLRTTYILRIHNLQGQVVFSSGIDLISSADEAVVGACIPNNSNDAQVYFATVEAIGGSVSFRMFFLGGGAIEYPTPESSVFGHPAVEEVLAVGTINASRFTSREPAFYSSRGPSLVNILGPKTTAGGLEVKNQERRNKPDLVAVDGVSVTGTGGFPQTFFGTSAAAPHVAGIAAQLMSVSPLAKPRNVRKALQNGAIDIGSAGFDFNSGYGIASPIGAFNNLKLLNPVPAITLAVFSEPTPPNLPPEPGPTPAFENQETAGILVSVNKHYGTIDSPLTRNTRMDSHNSNFSLTNDVNNETLLLKVDHFGRTLNIRLGKGTHYSGDRLVPGIYKNATFDNYLSTPIAEPLLYVFDDSGCNASSAEFEESEFTIYEIEYDENGEVTRMLADFRQLCTFGGASLSQLRGFEGWLRYDSSLPEPTFDGGPTPPTLPVDPPIELPVISGLSVAHQVGDNEIRFSLNESNGTYSSTSTGPGEVTINFRANGGFPFQIKLEKGRLDIDPERDSGLNVGVYEPAESRAHPSPEFRSWRSSPSCSQRTSKFTIHEISFNSFGELETLLADYIIDCSHHENGVTGKGSFAYRK